MYISVSDVTQRDCIGIICNVGVGRKPKTNEIWNNGGVCNRMIVDDTLSPTQEESAL